METRPSAAAADSAAAAARSSNLSRLLVAGQLALLSGLAATAARPGPWAGGLLVAGGALGLWALAAMPLRQMRIVPEVHARGRLVRSGPYRRIRHPMYSAVLLAAAGALATDPAPFRIALLIALVVLLVAKLLREERLLCAAYPDYAAYQASTWRLVPWIW